MSECAVALNVLFSLIVRADEHQEEGNNTARDHINKVCERGRKEEEMRLRCDGRAYNGAQEQRGC